MTQDSHESDSQSQAQDSAAVRRELATLVAQRAGHRSQATKTAGKIRALLETPAGDIEDSQVDTLEKLVSSLQRTVGIITDKDKRIETLTDEDSLETTIADATDSLDQYLDVEHDAQSLLRSVYDRRARADREETESQSQARQRAGENEALLAAKEAAEAAQAAAEAVARATTRESTEPREPAPTPPPRLKLPQLDLPKFSGTYIDWTPFKQRFDVSIHNDSILGDLEKFQYLISCLSGEALKLISPLQLTADNYSIAVHMLTERYENKRLIVRAYLNKIFQFQPVRSEAVAQLRRLQEVVHESVLALKFLDVELTDAVLVHVIADKLDPDSHKQWELSHPGNELHTYEQLHKFLGDRCRALESARPASQHTPPAVSKPQPNKQMISSYHTTGAGACPCCSEDHRLFGCQKFRSNDIAQRAALVQQKRLCNNCLQSGHLARECPSTGKCKECGSRHHTLLHGKPAPVPRTAPAVPATQNAATVDGAAAAGGDEARSATLHAGTKTPNPSRVLLPTAVIPVVDRSGQAVNCRALLDSGSQISCISERCLQKLRLPRRRHELLISTFGDGSTTSKGVADLIVSHPAGSMPVTAVVMASLTRLLPSVPIELNADVALTNVRLADAAFGSPAGIDIILGSDVFEQVVLSERIQYDSIFLRNTIFGWVVSGRAEPVPARDAAASLYHVSCEDTQLRKLWELDHVPAADTRTREEKLCEEHYTRTTSRSDTGRFVVSLPFKENCGVLGDSLAQAKRRFMSLEQRLMAKADSRERYTAFIKEYIDLGHLELVPTADMKKPPSECYYAPHHAVFKESSTTTKLRAVFDASAKTTSGVSLNDNLMVGPTVQDSLFNIILRFRFHRVAVSADVAKMYRQIELAPSDRDYHRIIWRFDPAEPLQIYRMTRVTYGVASSAYHAVRTLLEIADLTNGPAARVIREDFYVDDLLSGADSPQAAAQLQDDLLQTLAKGGLELRKFASNVPSVIERLPKELRETEESHELRDEEYQVKTLGIRWNPVPDIFTFTVSLPPTGELTKRALVSDTAKLFDPIGWLTPVIISFKILIQHVWTCGIDWDSELPENLRREWSLLRDALPSIQGIRIRRPVLPPGQGQQMQLHVFADASEAGYAAVVYTRITDDMGITYVNLLTAKSRVAPLKAVTLPRLELCAAHLAAKLMDVVTSALKPLGHNFQLHAWSDSTVTLAWISAPPKKWATFVANRVADIQDTLPPQCWNHVPTVDNPADCASRGLSAADLLGHQLWWHGPRWLIETPDKWPRGKLLADDPPEQRATAMSATKTQPIIDVERFSQYPRLIRAFAYVKRAVQNLKTSQSAASSHHPREQQASGGERSSDGPADARAARDRRARLARHGTGTAVPRRNTNAESRRTPSRAPIDSYRSHPSTTKKPGYCESVDDSSSQTSPQTLSTRSCLIRVAASQDCWYGTRMSVAHFTVARSSLCTPFENATGSSAHQG